MSHPQGSPPLSLAALDWQSILWTLLTAAIAAALTALVDSVLPDLKEKGLIDAAMFTLLTTALHGLRKFLTDTRFLRLLLIGFVLCVPSAASAQVVLDTSGVPAGSTFLLTVQADGTVSVRPTQVIRLIGGGPVDPSPPPPPQSPLAAEVERQTLGVFAAGGSKTTAAGLSSVYALVSSGVADGSIPVASALPAVKMATEAVLAAQPDIAKWATWRLNVGTALETLRQQGALTTKDQVAVALRQVSEGAKRASGLQHTPGGVLKLDAKALGILDGIDIAKLIELVRLVIELLKIFGAAKQP